MDIYPKQHILIIFITKYLFSFTAYLVAIVLYTSFNTLMAKNYCTACQDPTDPSINCECEPGMEEYLVPNTLNNYLCRGTDGPSLQIVNSAALDSDGDCIPNSSDNCDNYPNFSQQDTDGDGIGNICDPDDDGDDVDDINDNCPLVANPGQENSIHPNTTIGDACEDPDNDGLRDNIDLCPDVADPTNQDSNNNRIGDICESNGPQIVNSGTEDYCVATVKKGITSSVSLSTVVGSSMYNNDCPRGLDGSPTATSYTDASGALCAKILIVNNYSVELKDVYAEITSITPTDSSMYRYASKLDLGLGNGAQLPVTNGNNTPTDLNGGLVYYGNLAPGEAKEEWWIFMRPNDQELQFQGRVVYRGEEICDGKDNDCDGVIDEGAGCIADGSSCTSDIDCASGVCSNGICEAASAPFCGNGTTEGTEECDSGGIDSTNCDADCTNVVCGDGYFNTAANEECDDGNLDEYDGCDNSCKIVAGCTDNDADNYTDIICGGTDCDDTDFNVNPGAIDDTLDGIDQNCDGIDGSDSCQDACGIYSNQSLCQCDILCEQYGDCCADYVTLCVSCTDADGDGYTDIICGGADCNDADANINPSAAEICDGIDNDCDGNVDEGLSTITYYADTDGDGYGNPNNSTYACAQPAGYVTDNTDCDDTKSNASPGNIEICSDSIDNNCNGGTDESGCTTLTDLNNPTPTAILCINGDPTQGCFYDVENCGAALTTNTTEALTGWGFVDSVTGIGDHITQLKIDGVNWWWKDDWNCNGYMLGRFIPSVDSAQASNVTVHIYNSTDYCVEINNYQCFKMIVP